MIYVYSARLSRSYDMAHPPPPPPLQSISLTSDTQEDWERETTYWQERGKGGGRGAESDDGKKAWSSINHSILSTPRHEESKREQGQVIFVLPIVGWLLYVESLYSHTYKVTLLLQHSSTLTHTQSHVRITWRFSWTTSLNLVLYLLWGGGGGQGHHWGPSRQAVKHLSVSFIFCSQERCAM